MQKKIYHRILLVASVLLALLGACAQGEAVEADINNSDRDSIEGNQEVTLCSPDENIQGEPVQTDDVNFVRKKIGGRYKVSFFPFPNDEDNKIILIGYLTLNEGKYSYCWEKVDDVPLFMDSFFFVHYPEGTYAVEFREYDPGDDWEVEYIGDIIFSSDLQDENTDIDNSFLIHSYENGGISIDDLWYYAGQINFWSIYKILE